MVAQYHGKSLSVGLDGRRRVITPQNRTFVAGWDEKLRPTTLRQVEIEALEDVQELLQAASSVITKVIIQHPLGNRSL